ncbi:MAG: sterol desaturase family protein [Bacteroidetes bacterium]|nr:MAG: sterol desaturase family protein [Bacteroidota bacterium]
MEIQFYIFLLFFVLAVAFEVFYSQKHNLQLYNFKDSVVSMTLGITAVFMRVLLKSTWLGLWIFLSQFAIFKIEDTWLVWLALFFLNEFLFYWFHRLSHEIRILWAVHVNHHSSEMMNFTTAARLPLFNFVLHMIFWSPFVLIGFDPYMVFAISNISFLFAVFQHTQIIGKLPAIIEYIFVTPEHHRLHHASNPTYINHNYGAIFIVFDRWFGTFKEADPSEPIEYGITKNIKTYNPVKVVFHEWIDMFREKKNA